MERFIPRDVADDLRAVRDALPLDPASFDMKDWFARSACGTTCCIGGKFAVLRGFAPRFFGREGIVFECASVTGLCVDEHSATYAAFDVFCSACGIRRPGVDAEYVWLFFAESWPAALYEEYMNGNHVQAAQKAIDLYLAQYEILAPEPESQPQEAEIQEVS